MAMAVLASFGSLLTGHASALVVSQYQPAKLAAMEGHYPASAPAGLYLFGFVDEAEERTGGLQIPGLLSVLVHGDPAKPVTGLKAFPKADRPPVAPVFQAYHAMVGIGSGLMGLTLLGAFLWWRGSLFETRWLLWIYVFAVLGPQAANQLGWFTAEVGRQPWIVYGIMRTADAVSRVVSAGQILASLILFTLVYLLLFVLFIYLLDQKIRHGPLADDLAMGYHPKRSR
jgi:cytochrome d ubiquinol oxidase subunit I